MVGENVKLLLSKNNKLCYKLITIFITTILLILLIHVSLAQSTVQVADTSQLENIAKGVIESKSTATILPKTEWWQDVAVIAAFITALGGIIVALINRGKKG